MGFDVNFSNNKPVIQSAQGSQDGGAGNLGYFEREQGEKEDSKKGESIFWEEDIDTFQKTGDNLEDVESDFSISKFIAQIILTIKDFVKKLLK